MHKKAQRATLLADLGSHIIRNYETIWTLPQSWGQGSLCRSHNFLNPLRKERFLAFWQVSPLLCLRCVWIPLKVTLWVVAVKLCTLKKGKDWADRDGWWSFYLWAWGVFVWADALLVSGHEGKAAFSKKVSHNEHLHLLALKSISKESKPAFKTV